MLSSVVLPQPEWPMIETYSPFSMPSVMSFSTSVSVRAAGEGLVDVIDLEIGLVIVVLLSWRRCRG